MRFPILDVGPNCNPILGGPLVIIPAEGYTKSGLRVFASALGTVCSGDEMILAVDIFRPVVVPNVMAAWVYNTRDGLMIIGRSGQYGDSAVVVHLCEDHNLGRRFVTLVGGAEVGMTDPMETLPGTYYDSMARLSPRDRRVHGPVRLSTEVPISEIALVVHRVATSHSAAAGTREFRLRQMIRNLYDDNVPPSVMSLLGLN